MNSAYRFFLGLKHWQIFMLFIGLWFGSGLVDIVSDHDPRRMSLVSETLLVLLMFCFLAWFWSIGSFFTSIMQPALRPKMWLFRFAVVYPALYIFVFIWFIQLPTTEIYISILLLHLLAMFCMFYCLRFVSKVLVESETERKASFNEYGAVFFLMWFFPVGIWFVQPRINRLYQKNTVALQSEIARDSQASL